jgi:hypothetical protein
MKKKLTIRETIAMTWTFPIMLVVFGGLSIVALILFFSIQILKMTGTLGACLYLFDGMRQLLVNRKLKKLIKQDDKKHKFES